MNRQPPVIVDDRPITGFYKMRLNRIKAAERELRARVLEGGPQSIIERMRGMGAEVQVFPVPEELRDQLTQAVFGKKPGEVH